MPPAPRNVSGEQGSALHGDVRILGARPWCLTHNERLDCGEFSQTRGTAVFKRLAVSCAFFFLIQVAAHGQGAGQEAPPPGQEGPPPGQQEPPPRQEGPPPPRADASPRGDKCGSVAYTADGAFGAAYGMENCEDAERLAVDECVRELTDKPDCSRGAVTKRDSWFYVQFCRQGSEWTTHVTTKQTLSGVNQEAAEWARRSKYGAEQLPPRSQRPSALRRTPYEDVVLSRLLPRLRPCGAWLRHDERVGVRGRNEYQRRL